MWQDIVLVVESVAIIIICFDDHAMRIMAEESLKISRESLEAQRAYLELRKRWYESRVKKKENDKTDVGLNSSGGPDGK